MERSVLITSVGSGVGYGIVSALRRSGKPYRLIGLNSIAHCAGMFECDVAYLVPPAAQEAEYTKRLLAIIEKEKPAMVLAGRDAELPLLTCLKPHIKARGAFLLAGSPEAVQVSNDKYRTSTFFAERGGGFVRTAVTEPERQDLIAEYGFPVLVKPRQGHSSLGVKVLFTQGEVDAIPFDPEALVMQRYLVPAGWNVEAGALTRANVEQNGLLRQEEEFSVQVLMGFEGKVLGVFASKNTVQNGVPMGIEVVDKPELERQIVGMARSLAEIGLIGPCNFEAKQLRSGEFVCYEINARFTGVTPVRAAMGFNEVDAAYTYFVEGQTPSLEFDRKQFGYRYLTESVFSAASLETLQTTGHWQRPAGKDEG